MTRHRRWPVLATVLLGCLVCLAAGGSAAWVAGVAAPLILWGRLRRRGPSDRSLGRWRLLNAMVLVLCMFAAAVRLPLLAVAVALVAWLQVHRSFAGRAPQDDRIALLLALLQVLLGCILTISVWLAPLFLAFAVVLPVALMACHLDDAAMGQRAQGRGLRPPRWRWALGGVGLALSATLFFAIPRVQGAGVGAGTAVQNIAGFQDQVALGAMGEILANPEVVMRINITDASGAQTTEPVYLRGLALDHFDGVRWRSTAQAQSRRSPPALNTEDSERVLHQEIVLEPMQEQVLFGIPDIYMPSGELGGAKVDINGNWSFGGDPRRLRYQVTSVPPEDDPVVLAAAESTVVRRSGGSERKALRRGLWLQLPEDLDPRITRLAGELDRDAGPNASDHARAQFVARYLRENFSYSTTPPESVPEQALGTFLFSAKQGHCEYFATALAVLLRAQGLHARVVNGFHGGEWNPFGGYLLVRQSDAHAWVEVYLGTAGWVSLDATPEANGLGLTQPSLMDQALDWSRARWHRTVLDYSLETQLSAGARLRNWLGGLGGLGAPVAEQSGTRLPQGMGTATLGLALVAVVWALRRGLAFLSGRRAAKPPVQGRVHRMHRRARKLVRRRGWEIPAALPPASAGRWLQDQAGPSAAPLETLAQLHYRVRYGGEAERDLLPAARQALSALRSLPRPPRPSR